jgi:hypothetical protein
VAARLRRELGIEVETVKGHYGEYKVLVGDDIVVDGGPLVILGVMPSARAVVETVRTGLGAATLTRDAEAASHR